ncbi:MAG: FAD-binding oxidoreductase [Woeseiaceae bacterium]
MNRRKFIQSSFSAGLVASTPVLLGVNADTSIRGVSLDGREIELERAAIRELSASINGDVLLSGHPAFDNVRRIWNGMHDRRPALIVRCSDSGDIARAVTFARERNLLLSVRGGGHSWPGKSVCDDGMMLDLSSMRAVTVDAAARRAVAQGGALLGQLDDAALEHGLVTTAGVVSHTGVGGYTLGGGFGRLNRKYGLTIDNLRAAEIVTADGAVRTVSAGQEADLFWAIRGGGGNFGVVSKFEYELHPFDRNVLSGMIAWPVAQARDVLEFYAEWAPTLSRELYAGPSMMTLPDGTAVVAMEVVYNGDPSQGEKELAPLRAIGKPLEDGIQVQDYKVMQTWEDATFGHGIRSYAKNGMVGEFTQGLVDTMIDAFVADPRMAFFTHTAGGAVGDVGESDTAFPHRNAETMIIVAGGWTDAADDQEAMALGRRWFAALEPYTGGYYDNIQWDGDKTVARNYGPNYARLSHIKGRYDPGNLFRMNSNIMPRG